MQKNILAFRNIFAFRLISSFPTGWNCISYRHLTPRVNEFISHDSSALHVIMNQFELRFKRAFLSNRCHSTHGSNSLGKYVFESVQFWNRCSYSLKRYMIRIDSGLSHKFNVFYLTFCNEGFIPQTYISSAHSQLTRPCSPTQLFYEACMVCDEIQKKQLSRVPRPPLRHFNEN